MKYKYIFTDGSFAEVDVDEETYRVLRKLDRKVKYNNMKNWTVRLNYRAVEDCGDKGFDEYYNFEEESTGGDVKDEVWAALTREEHEARAELLQEFKKYDTEDKKEQLLKILTEKQALAYFYSAFVKMKKVHIAKLMGTTEGAVRKLVLKAETNLQKIGIKNIERSDELKLLKAIFVDNFKYEYSD
jgi:DNA-directed RNA polymerase specialized sigma24 family protein